MTERYPRHPAVAGQVLDATLHLLDRLVVDAGQDPVSYVSDVELSEVTGPDAPTIRALVVGSDALVRLFGGRKPESALSRVPWSDVAAVDVVVTLGVHGAGLDITWPERWIAEHIVGPIPGGRHAPD